MKIQIQVMFSDCEKEQAENTYRIIESKVTDLQNVFLNGSWRKEEHFYTEPPG